MSIQPGAEASKETPRRSGRGSIRLWCAILLLLWGTWFLFPRPDPTLWPPAERDETRRIFVTLNDYHSCINIPDPALGLYQEWHMGPREWYLGKDPRILEVAGRVASGNVAAVIRFGVFARPYWEREGIPEGRVYSFWLSREGLRNLLASLHRHRGHERTRAGEFWYFPYTEGYHLFRNCNSFTASALIRAGLPLREALALDGTTMSWQLDRCRRIQEDTPLPPGRG